MLSDSTPPASGTLPRSRRNGGTAPWAAAAVAAEEAPAFVILIMHTRESRNHEPSEGQEGSGVSGCAIPRLPARLPQPLRCSTASCSFNTHTNASLTRRRAREAKGDETSSSAGTDRRQKSTVPSQGALRIEPPANFWAEVYSEASSGEST